MKEIEEIREIKAFLEGYSRGNYGSAYESEDFETWNQNQVTPKEFRGGLLTVAAYWQGLILGFFSSYEDHEIPSDLQPEVCEMRKDPKVLSLGKSSGVS